LPAIRWNLRKNNLTKGTVAFILLWLACEVTVPMIDVSNALKNPGQTYPFECALTLPPMEVLSDEVRLENIIIKGELAGAGESVSVRGEVSALVHAHCARCLRELSRPIRARIDEQFLRVPDPQNPDQRLLDGFQIDLASPALESMLLEMPMRFLCDADCAGLCPTCGANVNQQPCCPKDEPRANPFAALSKLITSDDEEV
jgi:uncharacterized protein